MAEDGTPGQPDMGSLRALVNCWEQEAGYLRDGTARPVGTPSEAMAAQALAHAQQLRDALDGAEFG